MKFYNNDEKILFNKYLDDIKVANSGINMDSKDLVSRAFYNITIYNIKCDTRHGNLTCNQARTLLKMLGLKAPFNLGC